MTTLNIPDMHRGGCKATVENTIHTLDPSARISFDMPARRIELDSRAETGAVREALAAAGYPATQA